MSTDLGDVLSGPGLSPSVEPQEGLAGSATSIPIAGGWSVVRDDDYRSPHYREWFLCDPSGVWVAKFWDGAAAGERDARALAAAVAQGIEARQGGDAESGSVHESPVGNADAPIAPLHPQDLP